MRSRRNGVPVNAAIYITHRFHHDPYITDEEIQMRRSTTISALVLAGVIASPALVNAQTNPAANGDRDATTVPGSMDTDRNDDGDYGWVGLLGLAGLLGLRRRERADRDQVRTRQTV